MGHGVSAALLAASIKSAFWTPARITDPRSEVVCAKLLETFAAQRRHFLPTLFYAHLVPSGSLTFLSAGHPTALILRKTLRLISLNQQALLSALLLKSIGPPLGVSEARLMPVIA